MLKDDILRETGNDLPITGGYGMYPEDAIIIRPCRNHDLYSVETAVLQYLFNKYCTSYRIISQELLDDGVCVYDRFFTGCDCREDTNAPLDLTYIYFDITDCMSKPDQGD